VQECGNGPFELRHEMVAVIGQARVNVEVDAEDAFVSLERGEPFELALGDHLSPHCEVFVAFFGLPSA
jgi:hypothetical protein